MSKSAMKPKTKGKEQIMPATTERQRAAGKALDTPEAHAAFAKCYQLLLDYYYAHLEREQLQPQSDDDRASRQ